jgi:hypothetical protein
MSDILSRRHLVERLAAALHRARMRQGGDSTIDRVTMLDRDKAEAIVGEREEIGVYAPKRPSTFSAALRHPVVAGALLAVITGLFASVLVPALTRVWQDHPRELALKRDLVARISRESTRAVDSTFEGLSISPTRDKRTYTRVYNRWRLESAVIGSDLRTYFPQSAAHREWREYAETVSLLLETLSEFGEAGLNFDHVETSFRKHFQDVRFDDPDADAVRREFANAEELEKKAKARGEVMYHSVTLAELARLLVEEGDKIAADVVDADASGFSHGFWIFG